MRAKLEALCAKLEALQAEHSNKARGWGKNALVSAGWVMALIHCRAALRALLATGPQRVRMEPQPPWEESPQQNPNGEWCARFHTTQVGQDGNDEDTWAATAPSPAHIPVLVDGVWWWEVQP